MNYTYDVFDRRIAKEVDADGAGSGTAAAEHYVYDDQHIVLVFDEAGDLTHRYLHGPAVDQILADEDASTGDVMWTLADHQGTVRDLVDDSGTVLNHLTYDAFGNITSETNAAVDHHFAYTGRERDEETDLHYYRARYYDPAVGRFLSENPLGFDAGDANLYRYVGNGPAYATDPSGKERVRFSSGNAYWIVQSDGFFRNQDQRTLRIGQYDGNGTITLSEEFGGGTVSRAALEEAAGDFWNEYPDIGDSPVGVQREMVKTALQKVVAGKRLNSQNALEQQISAFGSGLKTGGKAVGNAGASTIVGFVSLGFVDGVEVFKVTEEDINNGYQVSYVIARGSTELLGGVATGAASGLGRAGRVIGAVDAASDYASIGRGVADVVQEGELNWENGANIVGGAAGRLGGFSGAQRGVGDGDEATRLANANSKFNILDNAQCFAPETLVATPEGPRRIADIRPGDVVLAYDHEAGEWTPRRVERFHENHYEGPLFTIHTDGGVVRTTVYHPFWVVSGRDLAERATPRELGEREDQGLSLPGRWVNSHELRVGDILIGEDGGQRTVLRIEQEFVSAFLVHNLTIADQHTFAVGPDAILVHNTDGCGVGAAGAAPTPGRRHGNTAGNQAATLYERYDADGNFLKHGISQNPSKRYTQKELDGGYLVRTQTGPRKEMLRIERELVETNPGPLNKEPWAGKRLGE